MLHICTMDAAAQDDYEEDVIVCKRPLIFSISSSESQMTQNKSLIPVYYDHNESFPLEHQNYNMGKLAPLPQLPQVLTNSHAEWDYSNCGKHNPENEYLGNPTNSASRCRTPFPNHRRSTAKLISDARRELEASNDVPNPTGLPVMGTNRRKHRNLISRSFDFQSAQTETFSSIGDLPITRARSSSAIDEEGDVFSELQLSVIGETVSATGTEVQSSTFLLRQGPKSPHGQYGALTGSVSANLRPSGTSLNQRLPHVPAQQQVELKASNTFNLLSEAQIDRPALSRLLLPPVDN